MPLEALLLEALLLEALLEALLLALLDALLLLEALLLLAAPPAPPAPSVPVVAIAPPAPVVLGLPPTPVELVAVVEPAVVLLLAAAPPDPVLLPLSEPLELLDGASGEEHAGASNGVATIARKAVNGSFIFKGPWQGNARHFRAFLAFLPGVHGSVRNLHEKFRRTAFCLKVRVRQVNNQLVRRRREHDRVARQEML